jgi:hypothetical protein
MVKLYSISKMPYGVKQKFMLPKTTWPCCKRSSQNDKHSASVKMSIVESAVVGSLAQAGEVIDCALGDSRPLRHSQLDVYSNDPDNDDQRSTWTCDNLTDHGYHQACNITTAGSAQAKPHDHPQGLTHVHFDNCVVKVRPGFDLDQLLANSIDGPVHLLNVQTTGWIQSGAILLPAFVLLRWISSIKADEQSVEVDDTYDPSATGPFRPIRAGVKVDMVNRD